MAWVRFSAQSFRLRTTKKGKDRRGNKKRRKKSRKTRKNPQKTRKQMPYNEPVWFLSGFCAILGRYLAEIGK